MSNLLDCPLKLTTTADIAQGLLNYIQSYHEDQVSHPDTLRPDLELIKSCRTQTEGKLHVTQNSLNHLTRYHAHLACILSKFPADIGVEFSYSAIFSTSTTAGSILPGELPSCLPIKLSNLPYERACVLFNAAAMMLSLGAQMPRSNTDQLKRAIAFFQQAAGCFSFLRDEVVKTIELPPDSPSPPSPDLSDSCLSALEHLSLSQAQECVWLQAVKDQKSNGIISRIAQETSGLYQVTLDFMKQTPKLDIHWIGFSFPDDWVKFVHLKSVHFLAVAQFRKGLDDSAAREYGIEVGRLEYACSSLKTVIQAIKSCSTETTDTVLQEAKNVFVKLQKSLEQARRDNDLIYLKQVPSEAELPTIKPVSLVKSTVPEMVKEPHKFLTEDKFGRKLFEMVVPYQIYRIRGVYEDRKKDHLKSMIEDVAESLDAEMVNALRSMNLPGSLEALERPINLPPSLVRNSDELRRQNAPQMLITMLSSVEQASSSNNQALNHIAVMLDEEEREDQELRTRFGTQLWQRSPSSSEKQALREHETQLKQTFHSATQSDRLVKEKYQTWRKAIELLCRDEDTIKKAIPPFHPKDLPSPDLSLPPTGETELTSPRQLRKLLDELEDLRVDRKGIVGSALHFSTRDEIDEAVLKSLKQKISDHPQSKTPGPENFPVSSTTTTPAVEIGHDEEIELVLERELSKYQKFVDQLQSNGSTQADVINRIRKVNQEFLSSRKNDPVTKSRENIFQELDLAYHEFHSIIHNLQEGFQFHSEFQKFITLLRNQVDKYVKARRIQAIQDEARLSSDLSVKDLNLQDHPNQTGSSTSGSRIGSVNSQNPSSKSNGKSRAIEDDEGDHIDRDKLLGHRGNNDDQLGQASQIPKNQLDRKNKKPIRPGAYNPHIHGPAVFSD